MKISKMIKAIMGMVDRVAPVTITIKCCEWEEQPEGMVTGLFDLFVCRRRQKEIIETTIFTSVNKYVSSSGSGKVALLKRIKEEGLLSEETKKISVILHKKVFDEANLLQALNKVVGLEAEFW